MEKKPFLTEAMAQEIIQDVPRPSTFTTKKASGKMPAASTRRSAGTRASRSILPSRPCPTPSSCKFCRKRLRRGLLVPDRADAQRVCGFTGSDIMFSSNQTPVEDMQKAYELGAYINLDDATMVDFLDRVAGVPETVFCRYNPGGTFSLGESEEGFQVMDKPGDAKYGMTEEQMIDSYKKLMAKGAKHFGIHAFLRPTPSRMPITRSWPPSCSGWRCGCTSHRCPHRLHQPVRRRGHPLPPGADRERHPGHWRGRAQEV